LHNVGSKHWNDSNWEYVQALGEDLATKTKWNGGQLPAVLPEPITIGDADCIGNGGDTSRVALEVVSGFPVACFDPSVLDEEWNEASAFAECRMQAFYAQLLVKLYDHDSAGIIALVAKILGPNVVTTVTYGTTLLPDVITIIHPRFSIAIVDGTSNFQQLALQAFQSIIAPTDFGILSTLPLWYSASNHILSVLNADGWPAQRPFFGVGHSYGAAAVLNVVARLRAGFPNLRLRFLTFGCPKIGDQRFVDLLRKTEGYAIANDSDIATVIPPSITLLSPILVLFPLEPLTNYLSWFPPPFGQLQLDAGVLVPNGTAPLDTPTLIELITNAVLGEEQEPIAEHRMGSYLQRIRKRCPLGEPPVVMPVATGHIVWGGFDRNDLLSLMVWTARPSFVHQVRGARALTGHPPQADPGDDCLTGSSFKIPTTVGASIGVGGRQWYRFDQARPGTYRIEFHRLTGDSLTAQIYLGESCEELATSSFLDGVTTTCMAFELTTDRIFVRVAATTAATYTIAALEGACP